jgi:hypothetical protein
VSRLDLTSDVDTTVLPTSVLAPNIKCVGYFLETGSDFIFVEVDNNLDISFDSDAWRL